MNRPFGLQRKFLDPDWHEAAVRRGRWTLEDTTAFGAAGSAASVGGKIPRGDVEPFSSDQHCATLVTIRAASARRENIANIGVTDAITQRDASRHMQR